jgi:hypothetical protein
MARGLFPQRYFGTIHAEYARIAAGRTTRGGHNMPGQKAEFHQPLSLILGKVKRLDDSLLAAGKLGQRARFFGAPTAILFETQLQHDTSI